MRSSVPYIEGCKQRSKVMNPNIRVHKDLVVESHQGSQHDKKQHSLTLNQLGSEMNATELAAHCVRELNNFRRGESSTEMYRVLSHNVQRALWRDRKSTRLNSSHGSISYAVFCLKKK